MTGRQQDQLRRVALKAVLRWARAAQPRRQSNAYRLQQFAHELIERSLAIRFLDGAPTASLISQNHPSATQDRVEDAIRRRTSPRRVR